MSDYYKGCFNADGTLKEGIIFFNPATQEVDSVKEGEKVTLIPGDPFSYVPREDVFLRETI